VVDVFDNYVIAEVDNSFYKINYTISGEDVNFSNPVQVTRKVTYEPVTPTVTSGRKEVRNGVYR
jgi:hypothetical protein